MGLVCQIARTLIFTVVLYSSVARAEQVDEPGAELLAPQDGQPKGTEKEERDIQHKVPEPQDRSTLFADPNFRSPGGALMLSLTPVPVDFGNYYAKNPVWATLYTAAEVGLAIPIIYIAANNIGGGERWSHQEKVSMVALVLSYMALKIGSGIHAAFAAGAYNDSRQNLPNVSIAPTKHGFALAWTRSF